MPSKMRERKPTHYRESGQLPPGRNGIGGSTRPATQTIVALSIVRKWKRKLNKKKIGKRKRDSAGRAV